MAFRYEYIPEEYARKLQEGNFSWDNGATLDFAFTKLHSRRRWTINWAERAFLAGTGGEHPRPGFKYLFCIENVWINFFCEMHAIRKEEGIEIKYCLPLDEVAYCKGWSSLSNSEELKQRCFNLLGPALNTQHITRPELTTNYPLLFI